MLPPPNSLAALPILCRAAALAPSLSVREDAQPFDGFVVAAAQLEGPAERSRGDANATLPPSNSRSRHW